METTRRVHNFGAGPAGLPLAVLEQVQAELLDFHDTGMSVMELSHRSPAFGAVIQEAEADLRTLLGLSEDYAVLFLQGGASLQFAMVPANLRSDGDSADYVLTGNWSKAALKEAAKVGSARAVGSTESSGFDRVPAQGEIDFDPNAAYAHFTSNNTIYGTQWRTEPEAPAGVPLVCDASSDILSHPVDITRYGVLYAGAQKNLGPAGIAVVVVRRDLLERTPGGLPALLDYRLMDEKKSLYNTPPTFAVYVVGRVRPVDPRAGGPRGDGQAQRGQGRAPLRRHRRERGLLPGPRPGGESLSHERHLPPGQRGPREGVPEGSRGRRPGGAQGPPLGGRSEGVDLQRLPTRVGAGPGGLHGGVPEASRLTE